MDEQTKKEFENLTQVVKTSFDEVDKKIVKLEGEIKGVKQDIKEVKGEVKTIKSTMLTKGYLDNKLADLEGSTVTRQKKQDKKVNTLVSILRERDLITDMDVERLKEFKIFPSADELV